MTSHTVVWLACSHGIGGYGAGVTTMPRNYRSHEPARDNYRAADNTSVVYLQQSLPSIYRR